MGDRGRRGARPTRPITAAPSRCSNGRWRSSRPSSPSTRPPGSMSPPQPPNATTPSTRDRRGRGRVRGRRRSPAGSGARMLRIAMARYNRGAGVTDPEGIELFDEALQLLDPAATPLRAFAFASRAGRRSIQADPGFTDDVEAANALLAGIESSAPKVAAAVRLWLVGATLGLPGAAHRLRLCDEALAVAPDAEDPWWAQLASGVDIGAALAPVARPPAAGARPASRVRGQPRTRHGARRDHRQPVDPRHGTGSRRPLGAARRALRGRARQRQPDGRSGTRGGQPPLVFRVLGDGCHRGGPRR